MSAELISPWAPARAPASPLASSIPAYQQRIERTLERELASTDPATARLCAAMRYSVLGGGQRLRPVLVYLNR